MTAAAATLTGRIIWRDHRPRPYDFVLDCEPERRLRVSGFVGCEIPPVGTAIRATIGGSGHVVQIEVQEDS